MKDPLHPAFDSEEQAILSQLSADDDGEMQAADETPTADEAHAADPTAADATPAATTQAQAEAKAAEDKPATDKPEGNVKAALRASRRAESRAKDEIERLRQENEQLRKSAPQQPDDQSFTADELESMKLDFPAQYKLYIQQQKLAQQLEEARAAAPAKQVQSEEFQPVEFNADVQELVDQVPDLLNWQHDPDSQEKLQRAIAYDRALQHDPDWAGKPLVERFAEAAERTKRAFGSKQAPVNAAPAAARRIDPATAIAALKPSGPKGISDFGGGQPASAPSLNFNRMSDEDILASLSPGE